MIDIAIEVGELLRLEDVVDNRQLAHLLRLEVLGLVEHLAIAIAQNVGREPSAHTQHTRLEHRRQHGLHQRLSALEVLACDGHIHLLGELPHGRCVHAEVGSTHHERSALGNGRISITHARRDHFRIVLLHSLLQRLQRHVFVREGHEDFRTCRPQYHDALATIDGLELADVLTELLHHVPASGCRLDVRTVQAFSKVMVESSRHRTDSLQFVFYQIQVFFLQHFGVHGCLVSIVGKDIPTAEHNIVQVGQIGCSLPSCIFIVAIWVIEPIAFASPLRAANTPVIIVVATAPPTPTTSTPRRPVAGLIISLMPLFYLEFKKLLKVRRFY